MKGFRTVFLKELKRFFTDTRMLFALFFPGILIFILYSFMGNFFAGVTTKMATVTDSTYVVAYSDNCGAETPTVVSYFEAYVGSVEPSNRVEKHAYNISELSEAKQMILDGRYDVVIAFSENFENEVKTSKNNHIDLYYDGASKKSTAAYNVIASAVASAYNNYVVNLSEDDRLIPPNITGSDFLGAQIIAFIVPMITTSLLFSTVISIAPDAVAGEKERGTMASMLLTPVKRRDIALGKAFALMTTAVASGLVSFVGIVTSIPNLLKTTSLSIPIWGYVLVAFLVVTTLALFVGIGLLVSTLAKSTKEANSYLGPLTVVFLAISIVPAVVNTTSIGFAFVPFLNIVSCMSTLLSGQVPIAYFLVTIGVSAFITAGIIFAVAKLFDSERVMVK